MTFLSPQAVGALCALGSALTWAVTSLLVRTVCPPLNSVTVSVVRSLIGGGLLLTWALVTGGLAKLGAVSAGTFALLAVSIVVAIEKMAPHGQRLARLLGLGLIAAGLIRLLATTA